LNSYLFAHGFLGACAARYLAMRQRPGEQHHGVADA
jgi:hypothetical protein